MQLIFLSLVIYLPVSLYTNIFCISNLTFGTIFFSLKYILSNFLLKEDGRKYPFIMWSVIGLFSLAIFKISHFWCSSFSLWNEILYTYHVCNLLAFLRTGIFQQIWEMTSHSSLQVLPLFDLSCLSFWDFRDIC